MMSKPGKLRKNLAIANTNELLYTLNKTNNTPSCPKNIIIFLLAKVSSIIHQQE